MTGSLHPANHLLIFGIQEEHSGLWLDTSSDVKWRSVIILRATPMHSEIPYDVYMSWKWWTQMRQWWGIESNPSLLTVIYSERTLSSQPEQINRPILKHQLQHALKFSLPQSTVTFIKDTPSCHFCSAHTHPTLLSHSITLWLQKKIIITLRAISRVFKDTLSVVWEMNTEGGRR